MNLYKEMWDIANNLEKIENYNKEMFIERLKYHVSELSFFYNFVVPKQQNNSQKAVPEEGQIVSFNLTRGFEFYDAHYCYILKKFNNKYLIIPLTALKEDNEGTDPKYKFDIQVKEFTNCNNLRLRISEMKTLDSNYLNIEMPYYNVIEDRREIFKKIINILLA